MRRLAVAGLAWAVAGSASAQPILRLESPDARVLVVPEDRADIQIEVRPGSGGARPVRIELAGDRVTVGSGSGAGLSALVPAWADPRCRAPAAGLPLIVAHVPRSPHIETAGAVFGRIGPAGSLTFDGQGCGDWTAEAVNGALQATVRDTGRLTILGGVSSRARMVVRGHGAAVHRGRVGQLWADLDGSGEIRVATVTGTVERSLKGTGEVHWGRPPGRRFCTVC